MLKSVDGVRREAECRTKMAQTRDFGSSVGLSVGCLCVPMTQGLPYSRPWGPEKKKQSKK